MKLMLSGASVLAGMLTLIWIARAASPVPAPSIEQATSRETEQPAKQVDPALVRRALLARMDAQIDAIATKSRLDARLTLNEVMPLPYLGVDSEPGSGGLVITAIYAETGAERCGLLKGDVLKSFDSVTTQTKASLATSVRRHKVGDTVELRIERQGSPKTLQAQIGPRPEEDEDEDEQFPDLVVTDGPPPAPLNFAFDDVGIGLLQPRFTAVVGGHGHPGSWITVKSDKGFALRQDDGDKTGIRFPMVIVDDYRAKDVVARVKFRFAGGRIDRAAGIVLRYRDPGNYLVARANAMEGDLRIFRLVNGDRRTLPGAIVKGATDDDRWHTLEFRVAGSELTAVLDGTAKTTAQDTFFVGGGVGLWTKADSRTEFDDFQVEATK